MTDTDYTNVFIDKILKPLHGLIGNEFEGDRTVYTLEKGECLVIMPTGDEVIGIRTRSVVRQFSFDIIRRYDISGLKDDEMYTTGADFVERFKRLIDNNKNYDGTTYYWHDGQVVSTEYEINEDDPQYMDVTMGCEFFHEDVKT